ncbi:dihydrodipicolinate synthase family protein [Pedobacter duraquae]|uniref:4-hydroxy-tetrahydrodipicolinate synthase n=1 Tax=Pedobacter duraquae TaxID=425511 RepID=A0A4V3C3L7_9SPHI|nr:dihydrodipicolinate synthase family protein [Pedobacter duraquae]TDO22538.1 4-hydroxy-tetrahydrodipicolinate synthase [Pedobacter duraquae]
MNHTPKEFIPVMLTPFKDDGKVDFDGLTELTEYYIRAGASGLFANCLSSEMFELTEQERLDVVKHVVNTAGPGIRVVATGTFGGVMETQADFVKKIYDQGVDAVIIITNMLAAQAEADEIFNANMFRLLDLTEKIPMGFYECPVPYKRLISATQLESFVDTGRIIYHKDTCLDIVQVTNKIKTGAGHIFGLYDAYMGHAVASLKAGSAGLSCIQGNYWPELIVWLCQHFDKPELKAEVDAVQQFFISNMDVMHHVYPVTAKYYLQKRGLSISAFTRQQVGQLTPEIKIQIDQLYQDYENLKNDLGLKLSIS